VGHLAAETYVPLIPKCSFPEQVEEEMAGVWLTQIHLENGIDVVLEGLGPWLSLKKDKISVLVLAFTLRL